jgi:hypothetical protein
MQIRLRLIAALVLAVVFQAAAQCPVVQNCPAQPLSVCDNSLNNAQFWNETYYWDNVLGLHDLFETETNLEISVKDSCDFNSLKISYVLLLDLDGSGVFETAIWSDSLPPSDAVYFGNAFNSNYSGGILRHFDERGVPADQKYGFALEQVAQGDTLTAKLRWNTAAAPTQYQLPQLPGGTHKIRWFIESGAAHDTCEQTFTIKDCKAPTVNCLGGLSVNIMPTKMIQLWASDFLKNAEDNITPASQIKYGIRKSGTGTGFPVDSLGNQIVSVIFNCAELGTQSVELWVQDKAGNADFCETFVIIQDNFGNCGTPTPAQITVCVETEQSNGVEDMIVIITGSSNSIPSFTFSFTAQPDNSGCVHFNGIPLNSTGTITPIKDDNPLNGVSTYDLILITKHLLSQEPLNSPYKMIAADANKSNSISTIDIVELRRLILGIYSELPNNTSWRCIPKNFTFPNPINPFQTVFPESSPIIPYQPADFVAVKVGDVNGTAIANGLTDAHSDDRAPSALLLPDHALQAGQTIEIPVTASNAGAWLGFQMGLQYDARSLAIESIEPGNLPGMSAESFATSADEIRCSWSDGMAHTMLPGDRLFTLHVRALAPVHLRDAISLTDKRLRAEAYGEGNQPVVPLQLEFGKIQGSNNGASVFAPQPNPTSAGATIPLQLTENTPVQFELRDVSGRLLYDFEQTLEAGRHLMDVPAAAMRDAGLYFWAVKAGDLRESGKLVRE